MSSLKEQRSEIEKTITMEAIDDFDLGDIFANSVGAIIGIIILLFYKKKLL